MILIAAVDEDWGIGYQGKLLFCSKRDQEHFRRQTIHHTVIMGRKTLESLPGGRPLKDRKNIVLSRQSGFLAEDILVVSSVEECLQRCDFDDIYYVIGGESIYRAFLDYSGEAVITKAKCRKKADVTFPNLDEKRDWKLEGIIDRWQEGGTDYEIHRYVRLK